MTQSILDDLYALLDTIRASIYWKNAEGKYLGCNRYMVEMAGKSHRDEIIGRTDQELVWGSIAQAIEEADRHVVNQQIEHVVEERAVLDDCLEHIFLSVKAPLRDRRGIIGVSVDITERKRQEEARKQAQEHAQLENQLGSEWLRAVFHDIRTPLTHIVGLMGSLVFDEVNPIRKDLQMTVLSSTKDLLQYCDELGKSTEKDLSLPVFKKAFDLRQLIERILSIHRPALNGRPIELISDVPENIPSRFVSDSLRLSRILINLVSNAIKFTEKGFIRIRASYDPSPSVLGFEVQDTGIGISERDLSHLTERFFRGAAEQKGYPGSGLGLFMVRRFVEDLGGSIGIDSKVGQGSTFRVRISVTLPETHPIK